MLSTPGPLPKCFSTPEPLHLGCPLCALLSPPFLVHVANISLDSKVWPDVPSSAQTFLALAGEVCLAKPTQTSVLAPGTPAHSICLQAVPPCFTETQRERPLFYPCLLPLHPAQSLVFNGPWAVMTLLCRHNKQ